MEPGKAFVTLGWMRGLEREGAERSTVLPRFVRAKGAATTVGREGGPSTISKGSRKEGRKLGGKRERSQTGSGDSPCCEFLSVLKLKKGASANTLHRNEQVKKASHRSMGKKRQEHNSQEHAERPRTGWRGEDRKIAKRAKTYKRGLVPTKTIRRITRTSGLA